MDLYNDSHEKVCILSGIKETCITSTLKTGDKEITFEFRKTNRYATDIKEEGYIRTDTDEFVIKQVEPSGEWYKCTGTLNVEELEGKQYPQGFETVEKTVDECLTEAIDGTGWKVIRCDVSKKRTIRIEQNCSAWDVAQQAITTYRCEMVFDSLNKGISVYEKYGEDRGAYFIERLNLKRLCRLLLSVLHLPVCPFSHFSAWNRFRKRLQMQQILRRATGIIQSSTAFSFPNSVASRSSVSQYFRMWYSRTSISLSVSSTSCRSSTLTASSIFDCSMIVCCFFTIADRVSVTSHNRDIISSGLILHHRQSMPPL